MALAVYWLAGVVGASSLPPGDQYSPQPSPYRSDVAHGPRGYPNWLQYRQDSNTEFGTELFVFNDISGFPARTDDRPDKTREKAVQRSRRWRFRVWTEQSRQPGLHCTVRASVDGNFRSVDCSFVRR